MKLEIKKIASMLVFAVVVICGSKTSKGQTVVIETPEAPVVPVIYKAPNKAEIKAMVSEKIAKHSFNINPAIETKVYPNPSAGQMNLAIKDVTEGNVTIVLTDMHGKEQLRKNVYHDNDGTFHENIDATEIPDGLYKITVIHSDFTIVKLWSKGLN